MKRRKKVPKSTEALPFPEYTTSCENCKTTFYFPLEDEALSLCNSCLENQYREDLQLDKYSLDEHMEEQHLRFEKWGAALAEMKDIYYAVSQMVSTKKAQLDGDIRLCKPEDLEKKFGIGKLSEKSIESAIERHDDYLAVLKLFGEARKRRDLLDICVEAFRDRRSMMKYLTELYVAQYFDRSDVDRGKVESKIAKHTKLPKKEG